MDFVFVAYFLFFLCAFKSARKCDATKEEPTPGVLYHRKAIDLWASGV